MVSHAKDYGILKNLGSFDCEILDKNDRLKLVRQNILHNIDIAFKNSSKRYNLRSQNRSFNIGNCVFRRNFTASNADKKFCSKFAPKFIKSVIVGIKGNNIYELEDIETGKREFYHAKDIRDKIN